MDVFDKDGTFNPPQRLSVIDVYRLRERERQASDWLTLTPAEQAEVERELAADDNEQAAFWHMVTNELEALEHHVNIRGMHTLRAGNTPCGLFFNLHGEIVSESFYATIRRDMDQPWRSE